MLGRYNIEDDAARAFAVLKDGGIAILPMDVGYSLLGGSEVALDLIFRTKGRASDKLNAMVGNQAIHEAIQKVDQRAHDVIQALTADAGLPLGVIAPCDLSHPMLNVIDMEGSNKDGTIAARHEIPSGGYRIRDFGHRRHSHRPWLEEVSPLWRVIDLIRCYEHGRNSPGSLF